MFWILITITAHFLNAIVFVIDKHFVSKSVLKPVSYVFYSGIFQVLYIVLIPFGFVLPEYKYLAIGIFDGALFLLALLVFYKAIRLGEASRVAPVIGGAIPIFTFLIAYVFLNEKLTMWQTAAFLFFTFGGVLMSSKFSAGKITFVRGTALAILAAFLFASYYSLMKFLFTNTSFLSGFILLQIGGFLGAAMILLSKTNRKLIFDAPEKITKNDARLFIPNKILAALAAAMIYYAISLKDSSVTIINSLQAVQYVFLLFLAVILSKKLPGFFKEHVEKNVIVQKVAAIALIGIGLLLLQIL